MKGGDWYKKIGHDIQAMVVVIFPEIAARLLERCRNVRNVNQPHLRRLEAALRAGNWELNGNTILIDRNGWMVDGEHRCWAGVNTGISFPAIVLYNVDPDLTEVDTGKIRQATICWTPLASSIRLAVRLWPGR